MIKNKTSLRGFTLLELIVVIAIIGVLSVIIIPSFTTALARSRDGRKVAELNGLQKELLQWAQNNNGLYPATGTMPTSASGCTAPTYSTTSFCAILLSGIDTRLPAGVFMNSLSTGSSTYNYVGLGCQMPSSGGLCQSYALWTNLEQSNSALSADIDITPTTAQTILGTTPFVVSGYTVSGTTSLPVGTNETCTGAFGTCIFDITP